MTDTRSQVKNGQIYQHNPLSQPPVAINLASRSSELEDDLDALRLKQASKDARSLSNTSPSPEGRDKSSQIRTSAKPVVRDITPKKGEADNTKSQTLPVTAINIEGATTFDPYEELQTGKSEEEVLSKLKAENSKLRKELKSISDDLTTLVDKKRNEKKEEIHPPHARDIIANTVTSEKELQRELEGAQKQLTRLQKEIAQLSMKYESHGTYEKYQARQQHLYDIENKMEEIENQRKTMDKSVREKEKVLDGLLSHSGHNVQVISMDEEARLYREKARESEKRIDMLEKQAQKRKEYTQKITSDLETLKQDFKKAQEKTGYEHKEKPKQDTSFTGKMDKSIEMRPSKKIPMFKQVEEDLPCTEENFEKLKKEIKILQKAEDMKGKKNERETGSYQGQITSFEKGKDEALNKIAEKKKEIDLLTTKLKDLSRIVRHHAVVPLQEELIVKELPDMVGKRHSSPGQRSRSSSRSKKDIASKRPQPYHLLIEYAKNNFQSKGYRKDEKGKPVREGEGVNFNDRDVVGKQKVKIIAIDVWYDETCITGIQVVYENEQKKVIEGQKHILNEEKSKKTAFETLEEDYLKEISGFMNRSETVIECLIMRTFRGETMRVGAPGRDSKLFKFDINEMEFPAVIFGSIKDEKNTSSRLARLGVLISSQSVEEKIEGKDKDVKNEKEVPPTDRKSLEKSQEVKDSGDVIEEIEEAQDLQQDKDKEEAGQNRSSHRKKQENSPRDEDLDRPIEEVISSRREEGSPRKR